MPRCHSKYLELFGNPPTQISTLSFWEGGGVNAECC